MHPQYQNPNLCQLDNPALIKAGVKNLRQYGYPDCNEQNILTDRIFGAFFKSMLQDNIGKKGANVDAIIEQLKSEIPEHD